MTKGHVFYLEPVRVKSQIYCSSVNLYKVLYIYRAALGWGAGEGGGVGAGGGWWRRGGGLRSSSQDSCFSHILGNDAEKEG
jgi:hypothetical protein